MISTNIARGGYTDRRDTHDTYDAHDAHDGHGNGQDGGRDDRDGGASSVGRWTALFADDVDHQYVSPPRVERAMGLIDVIGREASARGLNVMDPSPGLFDRARRAKWAWPHIVVATPQGDLLSFHVSERSRNGTESKPRSLADRASSDGTPIWQAQRSTRFEPTGTMLVRVDSDIAHYRVKTSRDSDQTLVETRIPNLFDMLTEEMVRCGEVRRRAREQEEASNASRRRCHTERLYMALCDEAALHERMQSQREYLDQIERGLDERGLDVTWGRGSGRPSGDPPTGSDTGVRTGADTGAGERDIRRAIAMMREHIDAQDPLTRGGIGWANQPEPTETEVFEYSRRASRRRAARTGGGTAPAGRHNGFFD